MGSGALAVIWPISNIYPPHLSLSLPLACVGQEGGRRGRGGEGRLAAAMPAPARLLSPCAPPPRPRPRRLPPRLPKSPWPSPHGPASPPTPTSAPHPRPHLSLSLSLSLARAREGCAPHAAICAARCERVEGEKCAINAQIVETKA